MQETMIETYVLTWINKLLADVAELNQLINIRSLSRVLCLF